MRIIDGDALVMWLSKWMVSSFGVEPTEETEAIRKVCDAVGDMVKDLAKDTGGDLISRAAAIDSLGEAPEVWTDSPEEFAALHQWEKDVTAIEALPSAEPKTGGNTNAIEIYNYLKERIYDTVDDMKEFDAWFERMVWHVKECDRLTAESKTGKWTNRRGREISDEFCVYCSRCKRWSERASDFCPNCGAYMRGEQDDRRHDV